MPYGREKKLKRVMHDGATIKISLKLSQQNATKNVADCTLFKHSVSTALQDLIRASHQTNRLIQCFIHFIMIMHVSRPLHPPSYPLSPSTPL